MVLVEVLPGIVTTWEVDWQELRRQQLCGKHQTVFLGFGVGSNAIEPGVLDEAWRSGSSPDKKAFEIGSPTHMDVTSVLLIEQLQQHKDAYSHLRAATLAKTTCCRVYQKDDH